VMDVHRGVPLEAVTHRRTAGAEHMLVSNVLSRDRVSVANEAEGPVRDKAGALQRLAQLLARGAHQVSPDTFLRVLAEREKLQSTVVGGGIAVPHGALDELDEQVGALLVCPQPIDFDAIDGEPVTILFGLVGPRGRPAEHLRVLARVSRLLRHEEFRDRLVHARRGADAYAIVATADAGGTGP
jgi:PTS system nitrogen regulatory IIA component